MMQNIVVANHEIPVCYYNTLIVGSGTASLSAAVRLKRAGQDDICIITDNINNGTSRNTGSDKQTYYKLSDSSEIPDSPYLMAQDIYMGGAVHGDIALVEALTSENSFYNLVAMGVPFPFNKWGGYTGYKTDNDSRSRGVSLGPYTSKVMVEYLEKECKALDVTIFDKHDCISLITTGDRIAGALVLDKKGLNFDNFGLKIILCNNMIFGLGGPGGMYHTSVYPTAHTGGIGLALEVGAEAVNLTESQFGIGSIKFRWNLSGSYQQVIPNYYSKDPVSGKTYQFLNEYFESMKDLSHCIFLKGYQWPFDPDKIKGHGSSLIDLLIYRECELHGREVYIDFRENLQGDESIGFYSSSSLHQEVSFYWEQSALTGDTPIERLEQLNPKAISLYKDHNIDLYNEPLQIAVCAQHNNGGLSGDIWWESTNISHFFPIGEVNGSHGVSRPGGSALNSGQVAAFRAAQKIASVYHTCTLDLDDARKEAVLCAETMVALIKQLLANESDSGQILQYKREIEHRMSRDGAFVRDPERIGSSCKDGYEQIMRFGNLPVERSRLPFVLKQRHLVFAHWFYLESIRNYVSIGGGSRGSYLIKSHEGEVLHPHLDEDWKALPDRKELRNRIQTMKWNTKSSTIDFLWTDCRPIPTEAQWFETVWAQYINKAVFD
ncbi:MAG: FAD-binding protein [Bacteroidetes bacterium]|nr:FAD-binding protein [Bacteroidota bacterium]